MSKQIASMYEVALRTKLRFDSPKGELSLERIWEMPLRSRDDFNLDIIAQTVSKALKGVSEESFVSTRKSAQQGRNRLGAEGYEARRRTFRRPIKYGEADGRGAGHSGIVSTTRPRGHPRFLIVLRLGESINQ